MICRNRTIQDDWDDMMEGKMNEEKALPCPFCGTVPDVREWELSAGARCPQTICSLFDQWIDLDAWNRRPSSWRKYTGKPEELPEDFRDVLICLGGERRVFSGYKAPLGNLWVPHSVVIGGQPIRPGDWWAYYPDPPKEAE
jgi:hypothetical protein